MTILKVKVDFKEHIADTVVRELENGLLMKAIKTSFESLRSAFPKLEVHARFIQNEEIETSKNKS